MEQNETVFTLDPKRCYLYRYKLRRAGAKNATIELTLPKEAFEREARRYNMSIDEAMEKLQAVWWVNSFPGLHLTFERKKLR